MRLIFSLAICIALLLLAPQLIYAQLVTLHIDKGDIITALDSIKQQTRIPYRDPYSWLRKRKPITIHVEKEALHTVLQTLAKNQVFRFQVNDDIVILLKDEFKKLFTSGIVIDQHEESVADATVANEDSGLSTTTDPKGEFYLDNIKQNTILKVYGYNITTTEFKVGREPYVRIKVFKTLTNNIKTVAINTGYQQLKKINNSGSDYSVNQELFRYRTDINAARRLEGLVPGLVITPKNRFLNQPTWFSIGARTSLVNPDPMIVINNFPLEGNLTNINPDDIEDITVLRDAAAVGIWGARAANGVIVIKTKSAKYIDRLRVSFNTSLSLAPKPNLFREDRMSAADRIFVDTTLFKTQYFDPLERSRIRPPLSPVVEALYNKNMNPAQRQVYFDSLSKLDNRHDQEKYFYRPTLRQHYFIQCEGGSDKHNFYISTGYDRIHPEWQLSREERKTLLLHVNTKYKQFEISAGISMAGHTQKNLGGIPDIPQPYEMLTDNNNKPAASYWKYRYAYIDTAGKNRLPDWKYYPLQEFRLRNNIVTENDYRYDAALTWDAGKIVPGLTVGTYLQHQIANNQLKEVHDEQSFFTRDLVNSYSQITPGGVFKPIPEGHIADISQTDHVSTNVRLQFSYTKKWGSNNLHLMAGKDHIFSKENYFRERIYGYTDDNPAGQNKLDYTQLYPLYYFTAAKAYIPYYQLARTFYHNYSSVYLNGLFRWKEKYDVTASVRHERSNLFGQLINNRKTPLLSAGFTWQLSSERFYHSSWLPYIRLSATYGSTGNPPYNAIARQTISYSGYNSNGDPYAFFINPPQYSLRWERVRNLNLGLNLRTVNDRIELSINWYSKSARDLVGYKALDPTSGNNFLTGNVGAMASRNLDIVIESKNILRKFRWHTGFMLSVVNDRVTHTEDTLLPAWMYCDPNYFTTVKGKPLYGLFSFAFKGLDNKGHPVGDKGTDYTGMILANGSSNLIYNGRATPALFGSVTNDFSYKQFNLSVTVLYKLNYYFRRQSINYYNLYQGLSAGSADFSRRWQKPGDEKNTTVPSMPVTAHPDPNRDLFYNYSGVLIERADHLRLQTIQLSYDVEGSALKKGHLRLANVFFNISNAGIIWRANKWDIDPDQLIGYRQPVLYTIGFRGTFK